MVLSKNLLLLLIIFIFIGLQSGCRPKQGESQNKIMVAGSTSIQPIAEKLAEHYTKQKPNQKIEVQGGGSSAGIQAAKSGAADIGTSSRELKAGEKDLYPTVIAYDAIILIVHPSNPLSNITLQEIRDIFSRKITHWHTLGHGLPQRRITMITREEGSGTRGAFEELVMHKAEISDWCLVQDSTGAVREIVASDPHAIGYISFGALNSQVKPLAIEGTAPTMANMMQDDLEKRYKLIRPFLFVTQAKPTGMALEFIQYIHSSQGANILQQEGLIPTHD